MLDGQPDPMPAVLLHHSQSALYAEILRRTLPGVDLIVADEAESFARALPEAAIVLSDRFPTGGLGEARRLAWIQCTNAGVDFLLPAWEHLSRVVVTNARGIHADVMADYAMTTVGMLHWGFPELLREQGARTWRPRQVMPLSEHTLGIVGLGAIGREIARRAARAGMRVLGVQRRPDGPVEGVDEVHDGSGLARVLAACDFLVLAAPATPETRRMIDAGALARMKPTAFLVNVARGSLVDEAALVRALRTGTIAGAALDVFAVEPLPADSPLWAMPNVIVTPHMAGNPGRYEERAAAIFVDNYGRFRAGEPLRNQVDLDRGY